MQKQLLMGNEAIARGAIEAGVDVATAYPGTPSSEIFSTLAKFAKQYNYQAEWSANEKAALEVAAGVAYTGARTIVTMKQVGLNVAADPLMTLAYIGVKGGMVLAVADDPGPHSSQNEQDTRAFAKFAKLPVFDPSSPQEAKDMTKYAFALSEELELPVFIRPTTRICHGCADVTLETIPDPDKRPKHMFERNPKWAIMPKLSYEKHKWLSLQQEKMREIFNGLPFNHVEAGNEIGIVASGLSYQYVKDALSALEIPATLLKIGTPYPLPDQPVNEFFNKVSKVLVIEEQDPVVEEQMIQLAFAQGIEIPISGKLDGIVPREGEFNVDKVMKMIQQFLGMAKNKETSIGLPPLPVRQPALCAGCPHRASFFAFKEAAKGLDAVFTGDIGCYTLGVTAPLQALDTCLCMGAGITIAAGLNKVEPNRKQVAFIGDSTFFHTGIPGLINCVYNKANITIVVLDNDTTAMTGYQPHPGLNVNAVGEQTIGISIPDIVKACGVKFLEIVDPNDFEQAKKVARAAMDFEGLAVVIMKAPCIKIKREKKKFFVKADVCTNCQICIKKLGCPSLFVANGKVQVDETCTGCGLCTYVCPQNAIQEVAQNGI